MHVSGKMRYIGCRRTMKTKNVGGRVKQESNAMVGGVDKKYLPKGRTYTFLEQPLSIEILPAH